jgi:D-sedoheptulose 7-phosphate isomerase
MPLHDHLKLHFEDHLQITQKSLDTLLDPLIAAIDLCHLAVSQHKRVLACGNGGSASDAQHFVAELVGRFERERQPLPAIALSTDTSILTAVGNDYGFEAVFARQVMALGHPEDVLVAITTSGNSPNVIAAVDVAKRQGLRVVGLTGRDGGKLAGKLDSHDVLLCVPHPRTMRIQEMHILLLHLICEGIDTRMLGEPT